jgi:hypothetical protein
VNRRSKILEESQRKFSGFSEGDVECLLKQALGCEVLPECLPKVSQARNFRVSKSVVLRWVRVNRLVNPAIHREI